MDTSVLPLRGPHAGVWVSYGDDDTITEGRIHCGDSKHNAEAQAVVDAAAGTAIETTTKALSDAKAQHADAEAGLRKAEAAAEAAGKDVAKAEKHAEKIASKDGATDDEKNAAAAELAEARRVLTASEQSLTEAREISATRTAQFGEAEVARDRAKRDAKAAKGSAPHRVTSLAELDDLEPRLTGVPLRLYGRQGSVSNLSLRDFMQCAREVISGEISAETKRADERRALTATVVPAVARDARHTHSATEDVAHPQSRRVVRTR